MEVSTKTAPSVATTTNKCDGNEQLPEEDDDELSESFEDAEDSEPEAAHSNDSTDSSSTSSKSSGSGSTSSSSSSDDEVEEKDTLEAALINNTLLHLPRSICENSEIFNEFLSINTWQSLPEEIQQHLYRFLPNLNTSTTEALVEHQHTIDLLFNRKIQRFGVEPLTKLQQELDLGNYRPDILKLRQNITKSRRREERFRYCERISQLAKQLFIHRERLLRCAYQPEKDCKEKEINSNSSRKRQSISLLSDDNKLYVVRARKRFHTEMHELLKEFNLPEMSDDDDENVDDNDECDRIKDSDHVGSNIGVGNAATTTADGLKPDNKCDSDNLQRNTNSNNERYFYGTLFKRQKNIPDEETIRMNQKVRHSRLSNRNFREYLLEHKRRKMTEPLLPDFETSDIRLRDVCGRAQMGSNFKQIFASGKAIGRRSKNNKSSEPPALVPIQQQNSNQMDINSSNTPNVSNKPNALTLLPSDADDVYHIMNDNECDLHQEEVETYCDTSNQSLTPSCVTTNDRNGLASNEETSNYQNMPKLEPIVSAKLKNMNAATPSPPTVQKSLSATPTELIQETHACFFSLIRDFFCATANHRMKFDILKEKIDLWLQNPITALNEWYNCAKNWSTLLTSAIGFLAGDAPQQPEDFVPYLEFKPQFDIYQWIGAGRDSDAHLTMLCNYWMQHINCERMPDINVKLNEQKVAQNILKRRNSIAVVNDIVKAAGIATSEVSSLSPVPVPRWPTNWIVRAATADEIQEFRRQERERFENPHRAYTYRMYGYESVVGPVKGIYSQILALTKARGHSMMVEDRPNFITILTLVRDAVARLPNGEGTRADISELLKGSQYISQDAADNVLQTIVSGALDRMHTEQDPCIRYDQKRKIWIYLHRNRSEAEFEKMHHQQQLMAGMNRTKKSTNSRKTKTKVVEDASTDSAGNGQNETTLQNVSTAAVNRNTFATLPALVPANSIIVNNSPTIINQIQSQQISPKCPPVPPLKYNIPTQQQKSLLKTVINAQRVQQQQQQQQQLHHQEAKITNEMPALDNKQIIRNTNVTPKQQFITASPIKTTITTATPSPTTAKSPIIVATPIGLQTVHITGNSPVTSAVNSSTATTAGTTIRATLAGKKVSLNKPIIISQLKPHTTAATTLIKAKNQQAIKQQQQVVINRTAISPVNVVKNNITSTEVITQMPLKDATSSGAIQTIVMDNIETVQQQPALKQTQLKNIIRLLPASAAAGIVGNSNISTGGGAKAATLGGGTMTTVIQPNTTTGQILQIGKQQQQQQQTVQIIGQRGINQLQQQKATIINAVKSPSNIIGGNASSGGSPSIVKVIPQSSFTALQQKQGQPIIIKQAISGQQQQQNQQSRVVVGNTAIITPSAPNQQLSKNTAVSIPSPKTIAASVSPARSGITVVNAQTAANVVNSSPTNKIQTINTANLTQQQRIILQSLKQQQQQALNKKMQVQLANSQQEHQHQQQQQQQQQQHNVIVQQLPRNQAITVIPHRANNLAQAAKPVAVVVSQAQGVARILKTQTTTASPSTNIQQNISNTTVGTKFITSSTGQLISLDNLIQKQSGAIKISGTNIGVASTKVSQGENIIQLAQPLNTSGSPQQTQQFAVVSQPRNFIQLGTTQRIITTQAGIGTTVATNTQSKDTSKPIAKVFAANGQQQTQNITVQQLATKAKIVGKPNMVTVSGVSASPTNVRVINASPSGGTQATVATGLNIANLQGKQVVFATKAGGNVRNLINVAGGTQTQTVQLQNAGVIIGGQSMKLQGNQTTTPMQTVIMGNQILRVQQLPQKIGGNRVATIANTTQLNTVTVSGTNTNAIVVDNTANITNANNSNNTLPKTIVLNTAGQAIRLQAATQSKGVVTSAGTKAVIVGNTAQNTGTKPTTTTNASPTNRVVLAMQGGNPVFLSSNLKALQNMKLVSLGQNLTTQAIATTSASANTIKLTPQTILKTGDSHTAD